MASISFGDINSGYQVGINNGQIYAPGPIERPHTPTKSAFTVPFHRDGDFVVNQQLLDLVTEKLSASGSLIALVGCGGVGKSHFAIEYIYRIRHLSPTTLIFWIYASSAARLDQCYRDIADQFDIPHRNDPDTNIFRIVHDWLEVNEEKWVMVLDGMDYDFDFFEMSTPGNQEGGSKDDNGRQSKPHRTYTPQSAHGSIIVTTRNLNVAEKLAPDGIIEIGPMEESLAMTLFQWKLRRPAKEDDIMPLARLLGFQPLAIVQAAASIKSRSPHSSSSLSQFHEELNACLSNMDDSLIHCTIRATSQIAFNHIRQDSPTAWDLLCLMSFLDPQEFSQGLLRSLSKGHSFFSGNAIRVFNNDHFDNEIATLQEFTLIHIRQDTQTIGMSSLVQNEVRKWVEAHGQADRWKTQFIKNLLLEFPSDLESQRKSRSLFPHVKAAMLQRPNPLLEDSLLEWATLMHGGARYAGEIGQTGDMEHMALEAMEVKKHLLGPDDSETIDASMTLTLAYLLEGRWKEAEHLAEAQAERCSRVLGVKHPTSFSATGYLALSKWYQGRWHEAELPSLKLLEIAQHAFGAEHPDTLTIMSNLAATYESQGRGKDAEEMNTKVVQVRKRTLGPEHPSTLTSMNNLAVIFQNQGRLEEAEKISLEVLQTRIRVLAAEHPSTLASMTNLASVYYAQRQFTKAEQLYIKVLDIFNKGRGSEHRDTLLAMDNLAAIYREQGRWAEAEVLQTQVLQGRQRILDTDHPDTLKSMVNLAEIYWHRGWWEDAKAIQNKAIEIQKRVLGHNHPGVHSSMDFLGLIYRSQGELLKAEAIHRQVIEYCQTFLGPEHPSTLGSMAQLALVLLGQGRSEEARKIQTTVFEKQTDIYGADHHAVLSSLNTLALIDRSEKRLENAEKTLRKVIDCRQRTFGLDHSYTLASMEDLASVLFESNQLKEAEALARKVNQTRGKLLREDHPDTLRVAKLLEQISEMKLAKSIFDDEDDGSSMSDFGSIVSSFSLAASQSSATTLDNATVWSAVKLFTDLLLEMDSFKQLCRIALESDISKVRIQRNLGKVLRLFASHLSHEAKLADHAKVIRFVRGSSSRIASQTILSLGIASTSGLGESDIRQVKQESSRAKILEYLGGQDTTKPALFENVSKVGSEEKTPKEPGGHEQVVSDSDSDSDANSIQDALETQQPTTVNDLQSIESIIFKTNAFEIMQTEFFDFLFPSLRSILMKWISKQRRAGALTSKQLRDLEMIVSELQHVAHHQISFTLHDSGSIINSIKGKWEGFTLETWDWWPLSPYMRPLANEEARMQWRCGCGRARWAEVPISFAKQVINASPNLDAANRTQNSLGLQTPSPAPVEPGQSGSQTQGGDDNPSPYPPQAVSRFTSCRLTPEREMNLHVFLVVTHSSLFRRSRRLAQTSVNDMNDEEFFSWIRTSYYRHRGFFATWFGVHRYSHCEFFKFEKYKQDGYAPLVPEFPSPQEISYHFYPKPISPEPPVSPHEFNHWFLDQVWYIVLFQRISKRISKAMSSNAGSEYAVVDERLPKRDRRIEEQDSAREVFWGLYIVERRSTLMLVLYSFIFLVPSFYFFFAWLFQWGHSGDLQNASVPFTVAFGSLGTFWVIISLKSPRFEGHLKID